MKNFILFIVSLCFFASMGTHLVDDVCYANKISANETTGLKTGKSALKPELQLEIVKKNAHSIQKKDDLINDENEDEEVENGAKCTFLTHNFILANINTFLSISNSNCPKIRLPFCKHLSYTSSFKYILQRVLRI